MIDIKEVILFLKLENEEYKKQGLIPTLDLLIEDLEKGPHDEKSV